MGVRAAMCLTAGVTRFPFWRFFLADLTAALLSVPLFIWMGYWFANAIPTLRSYLHVVQWGLFGLGLVITVGYILWRWSRRRPTPAVSAEKIAARLEAHDEHPAAGTRPPAATSPSAGDRKGVPHKAPSCS